MTGLHGSVRISMICLAVMSQYRSVINGHTDRTRYAYHHTGNDDYKQTQESLKET